MESKHRIVYAMRLIALFSFLALITTAGSAAQLPSADSRASQLMDSDHFDAAPRIPPLGRRA